MCKKLDTMVNPFTVNDFVVSVSKRSGKSYVKTNEKGEDGKPIMIQHSFLQETEPYTRFYINAAHRQIMANLSASAKCLLLWMIYEVESGKDWCWFNRNTFIKDHGYSDDRTYRNAVEDLMRCGIITMVGMGLKDVFWINPRFFFRGDRKSKYKNNIKIIYDEENNRVGEPEEKYGESKESDTK